MHFWQHIAAINDVAAKSNKQVGVGLLGVDTILGKGRVCRQRGPVLSHRPTTHHLTNKWRWVAMDGMW